MWKDEIENHLYHGDPVVSLSVDTFGPLPEDENRFPFRSDSGKRQQVCRTLFYEVYDIYWIFDQFLMYERKFGQMVDPNLRLSSFFDHKRDVWPKDA